MLTAGENCWRIEPASRVGILIDGAAYFRAFREAVRQARRSVLILGWEIDGSVQLVRDDDADDGDPSPLAEFLDAVVRRRESLEVHVLVWDFARMYEPIRKWRSVYELQWRTHRRVHFRLDSDHPVGGCHHQKIVVIDDGVAFVGGLDLTWGRWDTPAHAPSDERRDHRGGRTARPYHDVQMVVDGEAAAALGDLARRRWQRATGRPLKPVEPRGDVWPVSAPVALRDVSVGIARTEPTHAGRSEVREVERLYLNSIDAARRVVYIENQYLTCGRIGNALQGRLAEPDGPEIVIVTPLDTEGWISRNTMDVLRARLVRRLREADRYDRLRIVYPYVPGAGDRPLTVHSKLMIADEQFLRIGSANLNNRSMGIDTECDLAVVAGDEVTSRAIVGLRDRLLAEHLGETVEGVAQRIEREGSVIRAVDALRSSADSGRRPRRTLRDLKADLSETVDALVPGEEVLDPHRPLDADRVMGRVASEDDETTARWRPWLLPAALVLAVGLAIAWRWTPLDRWLDVAILIGWVEPIRHSPAAPAVVLGAFVIGSAVAVPVTLLIVATMLVFEPAVGFAYALVGAEAAAIATYWIGRGLGGGSLERLAGSRIARVSRFLPRRGILTVLVLRLIPIAPFTVINIAAGAARIRLRDFAVGTLLGMAPGIGAAALLVDRVAAVVRSPQPATIATLAAVVAAVAGTAFLVYKWLARRGGARHGAADD